MSAGRASFAPTSASFGSQPSDAYFLLDNPPGPVTIGGPLTVDGQVVISSGTANSLSTSGDALIRGGLTVGTEPGTNQIVGFNGSGTGFVTSVNFPLGLTAVPPTPSTTSPAFTVTPATGAVTGLNAMGTDSRILSTVGASTLTWTGSPLSFICSNQIFTLQLPADFLTNLTYPDGILFERIQSGSQGGSTLVNVGATQVYNISPGVAPLTLTVRSGRTPAGVRQIYYVEVNNGGGVAVVNGF
jgi:hypothetical protein